jgi:hypothetical protein
MEYSWTIRKDDRMLVDIQHNDTIIMTIYVGEIMEYVGRKDIMDHVRVCDKTPWLTKWLTPTEIAVRKTFNTINQYDNT